MTAYRILHTETSEKGPALTRSRSERRCINSGAGEVQAPGAGGVSTALAGEAGSWPRDVNTSHDNPDEDGGTQAAA